MLEFLSKAHSQEAEAMVEKVLDDMGSSKRKRAKVRIPKTIDDFFLSSRDSRKLNNPIDPYQVDVVMWIEWDRINLGNNGATTATRYQFFTTPQGQGGKTKLDTSLTRPQELDNPEYMNVMTLGFEPQGNITKADIDSLDSNYWAEFWVGKKSYAEGPWRCFPSGFIKSGETTRTAEAWYQLGNGNAYDLRLPAGVELSAGVVTNGIIGTVIGVGESFHFDMLADAGFVVTSAVALNMRAFLCGIKVRGVS